MPCHRLPAVSPDTRSMKRPASRRPIPPQRRRSVPISNEHRLVEPDTLGTAIKSTSMGSWRCTLAWRRRATAAGRCCDLCIRPADVTCPELCCSPSRASSHRTGSLWPQPVWDRLGAWLRNVNVAAALRACRNADSARQTAGPTWPAVSGIPGHRDRPRPRAGGCAPQQTGIPARPHRPHSSLIPPASWVPSQLTDGRGTPPCILRPGPVHVAAHARTRAGTTYATGTRPGRTPSLAHADMWDTAAGAIAPGPILAGLPAGPGGQGGRGLD